MEIIIATIGLNLGILAQDMFSIIVVMAMATSLMAPSALRWVLKRVEIGAEEKERLKKEEMEAESLIAGVHRILLPIRFRSDDLDELTIQSVEAEILELLGRESELSLTLFTVARDNNGEKCEEFLEKLSEYFNQDEIVTKVVEEQNIGDAILDEAKKDYELIVLGATERQTNSSHLFSPLIDYLTRVAPCPTLIVQGRKADKLWSPERVLVPTNGSEAAKNAVDLGLFIAKSDPRHEVSILNVVIDNYADTPYHVRQFKKDNEMKIANNIMSDLQEMGEAMGVKTETVVERGDSPEQAIYDFTVDNEIDLVILGTNVRPGSHRLYLGHRVETILEQSPCPVLILNT
jgi:nucleotide-binding universal stress UspA family protein